MHKKSIIAFLVIFNGSAVRASETEKKKGRTPEECRAIWAGQLDKVSDIIGLARSFLKIRAIYAEWATFHYDKRIKDTQERFRSKPLYRDQQVALLLQRKEEVLREIATANIGQLQGHLLAIATAPDVYDKRVPYEYEVVGASLNRMLSDAGLLEAATELRLDSRLY